MSLQSALWKPSNQNPCLICRIEFAEYSANRQCSAFARDLLYTIRDLSRPPRGVITPRFHATPPNHLKFKGGYQGGVYGGVYVIVMEWVINVVKN